MYNNITIDHILLIITWIQLQQMMLTYKPSWMDCSYSKLTTST